MWCFDKRFLTTSYQIDEIITSTKKNTSPIPLYNLHLSWWQFGGYVRQYVMYSKGIVVGGGFEIDCVVGGPTGEMMAMASWQQ